MRRYIFCVIGIALVSTPLNAQTAIPTGLEHLQTPQISTRPAEKMLVVKAKGDPRTVGAMAFGLLFQLYYQIPESAKGPQQAAPRARWPVEFDQPRDEWVGLYALPVPESVSVLPGHTAQPGLEVMLSMWDYGEVAEVIHIGPYDQEESTLKRLRDYVEGEGYQLAAEHEEEYIRGPTMAGPGNPDQYITILRYRIVRTNQGRCEKWLLHMMF